MKKYKIYTIALLILGFTACSSSYKEAQMYPQSSVDNKAKSNVEISGEMTLFVDKTFN